MTCNYCSFLKNHSGFQRSNFQFLVMGRISEAFYPMRRSVVELMLNDHNAILSLIVY